MTAEILSDDPVLTLDELCRVCGLTELTVRTYVEEGVIEVHGVDATHWRFSEVSVVRIQKAWRLERDLHLNAPGVALALELMSRIEELERKLQSRANDD
jgi:chaperone modulatory protein CbpM